MVQAQDNFQRIASLMAERKRLQQKLDEIEVKLQQLHRLEGLPYLSAGGKVQPGIAAEKTKQHRAGREEAARLGITYGELRDRKTAKRFKITTEELATMRLECKLEATKAGLSLPQWREREAAKMEVNIKEFEKAWAAKRFSKKWRREL